MSPFAMHDMRKLRKNVTYATQNVTASVQTTLEVELNPKEWGPHQNTDRMTPRERQQNAKVTCTFGKKYSHNKLKQQKTSPPSPLYWCSLSCIICKEPCGVEFLYKLYKYPCVVIIAPPRLHAFQKLVTNDQLWGRSNYRHSNVK